MVPASIQGLEGFFTHSVERFPGCDCWLWKGKKHNKGYGRVGNRMAHLVVWEILRGPVPPGLELDHICRTPRCVNPEHLEPVTHAENMRRRPWYGSIFRRAGKRRLYMSVKIDGKWRQKSTPFLPGQEAEAHAALMRYHRERGHNVLMPAIGPEGHQEVAGRPSTPVSARKKGV